MKLIDDHLKIMVREMLAEGPQVSLRVFTARLVESPERGRELETTDEPLGAAPLSVVKAALQAYIKEARKQGRADLADPTEVILEDLQKLFKT